MSQLCQMTAFSASSRWTMRAHRPAGMRPPLRSRPSWLFRVQMTASTRWRSQFGNGRGCFSSLRAGRIRVSPGLSPAKNSSVPCPDRPLPVMTAVPGAGRFAGWRSGVCRAWSRSPQLGVREAEPGDGPVAGAGDQQLGAPVPAGMARAVPVAGVPGQVGAFRGDGGGAARDRVASISRSSSAVAGVASASQRRAASVSGASCRSRVLYWLWAGSRGNRCPTRRGAATALVRGGRPRPRSGKAGVRPFWPRRADAGDVAAGLPPVRVSVRCPP